MPPTFEYVMVRLNAELVDRIDEIKDPLVPRDPFIRQLLSDGLNINITQLFSVSRYDEVAQATTTRSVGSGGSESRTISLPILRP